MFVYAKDYKQYLQVLTAIKTKCPSRIYGYCLLPKLIELIIQPTSLPLLNRLMRDVGVQYNAYLAGRYHETEPIVSKYFRIQPLLTDAELIKAITEIEFLPVRHNLTVSPGGYAYSSFSMRVSMTDKEHDQSVMDYTLVPNSPPLVGGGRGRVD